MHRRANTKAFTLAELLVTLIVTGILLSALATLAFALSSATVTESNVARTQSQLRQGMLRLGEVIRRCRLICAFEGNALAIWAADDNYDGAINVDELVYLQTDDNGDGLQLCQFSSQTNPQVTFTSGSLSQTQSELIAGHAESYVSLVPDAHNVQLTFDDDPPLTRRLTVSFDLTEDDSIHHYQVDMTLHAWAGHLLNAAGDEIVSDDDD